MGEPCIVSGARYICNAPINCNVTAGLGPNAICGGDGASVNIEDGPKGLDFGLDYCLSGVATKIDDRYWICGSLERLVSSLPQPPTSTRRHRGATSTSNGASGTSTNNALVASHSSKKMIGPIIGGAVGGVLVALLIFAFWCYRRRKRQRRAYGGATIAYSNEPAPPLLHRRDPSDQSQAMSQLSRTTTDVENGLSPLMVIGRSSESQSMGITASPNFTQSERQYQQLDNVVPTSPSTPEERDLSLPFESHSTIHTRLNNRSLSEHGPTSPASLLTTIDNADNTSQVAMPSDSPEELEPPLVREKSQYSSAPSTPNARRPSSPPPPLPPLPVSTEDLEQNLQVLRDEADRRLAVIRAHRDGGAPPPYEIHRRG